MHMLFSTVRLTLPIPPAKVTGILLLNVSDQLERAREVLRLQPRVTHVAQLKRLIALGGGAGGLIRVVDTPASSSLHVEP